MARLIKHSSHGPKEVKIGDQTRSMCMCGLSNNKPFCDSSHNQTLNEEEGKLYIYKDGKMVEIEDEYNLDSQYN